MPGMISANGEQVDVQLSVHLYQEALKGNMTVPQLINKKYPTTPDAAASSFEQLCVSCGLITGTDRQFGLASPTIGAILDGSAELNAQVTAADGNPSSRILYPAVALELIEDALAVDRTTDPNSFDEMVGMDISVTGNRIEQPVINLTGAEKRAKAISQLANPEAMLTITASDTSRAISNFAIGLEISDQALQSTTLDFVSMAVARQNEVERNARAYDYLLGFLNGDLDNAQSALSQTKADTYDSTLTTAGTVSKKALVLWLLNNVYKRQISHVVTDIAGMLAIETALATTNTNQHVPGSLVPTFSVMNRFLSKLRIFIVDPSSDWPANTLMGLDKRFAITRVRNSAATYSAVEKFVLRRSNALRFDFAEIAYRTYDDAFDTLSLTLTP